MNTGLAVIGAGLVGYYLYQQKQAVSELKDRTDNNTATDQSQDDRLEYLDDRITELESRDIVQDNLVFYPGVKACTYSPDGKFNGNFYFLIANESKDSVYYIKKFKAKITLNGRVITTFQPGWHGDIELRAGENKTIWIDSFKKKWFGDDLEAMREVYIWLTDNIGSYVQDGLMANISVLISAPNGGNRIVEYNHVLGNVHCYSAGSTEVRRFGQNERNYNALQMKQTFKDLF